MYARTYAERFALPLPVADRFLATQVLEPGEMLAPRGLRELAAARVDEVEGSAPVQRAAGMMRDLASRLAAHAAGGGAHTTYLRPHGAAGAMGTVLRLEFLTAPGMAPEQVRALGAEHAAVVASDVYAPHLLEPFCQYMVDRQAKAISAGTVGLRERMLSSLPADDSGSLRTLLSLGYRTGR